MKLCAKKGVILGTKHNKYIRYAEPLSTLVYAPPDSGKTSGIIIPSVLSSSNSVVVHDPKGEVYNLTAAHRNTFSKVIKFCPADESEVYWNPFDQDELPDDFGKIEVIVSRIAESIIKTPTTSNPMWSMQARSLFVFWSLYLIYKNKTTTFSEITKNVYQGQEKMLEALEDIEKMIEQEIKVPERLFVEAKGLANIPPETFGGIMTNAQASLQIFLDAKIKENTSKNSFSFKNLKKERTSIYIIIKEADQSRLKGLTSMFFEILTTSLLNELPQEDEIPVTLYLDEFVRLGKMPAVLNMPALGRGYNFNAVFICQSLAQIEKTYSKEDAAILQNTCAYFVIFSQNEISIAKTISESIGKSTRLKENKSFSSNKQGKSKSSSESEEGHNLLLPQDLMNLGPMHIKFFKKKN